MKLAGPIDLPHSLQGGQSFRWGEAGGAFRGVIGDSLVELRPLTKGSVEATGAPRSTLASYFRLERADVARRVRLARDPVLAPAMRVYPGLRLLRQDPWETTVAFLTSANNNVLRIEGSMRALAARFGEPIREGEGSEGGGRRKQTLAPSSPSLRAFPGPARLARVPEAALRACGLGYRAPFLRASARMVARGEIDLASLRGAPREEVREALLALPGVGPKVADCIALFSLDVDDAFPIDRWMLRAMEDAFGRAMKPDDAAAFARKRWGRDAGLAQQYLFHAMRMRAGGTGTARLLAQRWIRGSEDVTPSLVAPARARPPREARTRARRRCPGRSRASRACDPPRA